MSRNPAQPEIRNANATSRGREMRRFACLLFCLTVGSATAKCSGALEQLRHDTRFAMGARDALVTTRRQAQDFKNLLLRGSSEVQYQTMRSRFNTQADTLRRQVGELELQTAAMRKHVAAVEKIAQERVTLERRYGEALAEFAMNDPSSAFRSDKKAAGIDVAMLRSLEQLIQDADRQVVIAEAGAADACQ